MIREFSEEKKRELYGLLDEIDGGELPSFSDFCRDRKQEFGDWADKLGIQSYTRQVDAYQNMIRELNNSTRRQIDTVFENVAEVDRKYAEIFRHHQEVVKGQIAIVKNMQMVMRMASESSSEEYDGTGIDSLSQAIDRYISEISIEGFEIRLNNYRRGLYTTYEELCEYLASLVEKGYITQSDYQIIIRYLPDYGHVESSAEETITNNIYTLLAERKKNSALLNEKIEEVRANMSSKNPEAILEYKMLFSFRNEILEGKVTIDEIEEAVHIFEKRDPRTFAAIGSLYIHSTWEYEKVVKRMIDEYRILVNYVNEMSFEELDWNIKQRKEVLGEDFILEFRKRMLECQITEEDSVKIFLISMTAESGSDMDLLEDGGESYYNINGYSDSTKGAGPMQITGKSQSLFIEYLITITDDPYEKKALQELYEGFYKDENNVYRNEVLINGMSSAEYIVENYAIESAIWYWGINGFRTWEGEFVTLDSYIDYFDDRCDKDVLFLVTQYYVNGSKDFDYTELGEMCLEYKKVVIGDNSVVFENHSNQFPNGWELRKKLWNNWKGEEN